MVPVIMMKGKVRLIFKLHLFYHQLISSYQSLTSDLSCYQSLLILSSLWISHLYWPSCPIFFLHPFRWKSLSFWPPPLSWGFQALLQFDLCGFLSVGVEISFLLVGPESETHFGTEIISRQKHKYEASIERNTESKRVERRKVFYRTRCLERVKYFNLYFVGVCCFQSNTEC